MTMKVFIDFRTTYKTEPALGVFTKEYWQELAILHSGHSFFFIYDEKASAAQPLSNVQQLSIKRSGMAWFDRKKLQQLLRKNQADRLVTVLAHGLDIRFLHVEKKMAPVNKRLLFTGADAGKSTPVTVVQPVLGNAIPAMPWAAAESIRTQYTAGKSFFLFIGNITEQDLLVDLLKAFSVFKKWQHSNMQLVIAGYTTAWTPVLEEKLLTYKYRNDVVVQKDIDTAEIARLVGACYAMLYPSAGPSFPLSLLWALQSNKAVIASGYEKNRSFTAAAEWVPEGEVAAGFAKAMLLLYKDEQRQQALAQQAALAASTFSRQQMLTDIWQCVTQPDAEKNSLQA